MRPWTSAFTPTRRYGRSFRWLVRLREYASGEVPTDPAKDEIQNSNYSKSIFKEALNEICNW
ncbi:MAG: hypothetical protein ABSC23_15895 [Bryobacteraceae bacterium]